MTAPSLDHAVNIHLALIQFFRDGHCTSIEEIARRYGIGLGTAQRYIVRVDQFVPLQRNGPNIRKAGLR